MFIITRIFNIIFLLETMPTRWSTFLFLHTFPSFSKTLPRLLQNHVIVCPMVDRLMPHYSTMYMMANAKNVMLFSL